MSLRASPGVREIQEAKRPHDEIDVETPKPHDHRHKTQYAGHHPSLCSLHILTLIRKV